MKYSSSMKPIIFEDEIDFLNFANLVLFLNIKDSQLNVVDFFFNKIMEIS